MTGKIMVLSKFLTRTMGLNSQTFGQTTKQNFLKAHRINYLSIN